MGIALNYKTLPDVAFEQIEKGLYVLEVEDIIEDITNEGGQKFVCSHKIVNTDSKINFDNYILLNADGTQRAFGTNKLKKLIDATGIKIDIVNLGTLKALLPGKRFKANLVLNDKGYPQINFADIFPMTYQTPAINEQKQQKSKDEQEATIVELFEDENENEEDETEETVFDDLDI